MSTIKDKLKKQNPDNFEEMYVDLLEEAHDVLLESPEMGAIQQTEALEDVLWSYGLESDDLHDLLTELI